MEEEYTLLQSRRSRGYQSQDKKSGFIGFLLMAFMVTALARLMFIGPSSEKTAEYSAILQARSHLFKQYDNRLDTEEKRLAEMGSAYSFKEAYALRYDLYPLFDSLSRVGLLSGMNGLERFLNAARTNYETRLQAGLANVGEYASAQQLYGIHPMEAQGKVTLAGLLKIPKAIFNHVVFCMLFMPLVLIGRLMYRTKFSSRALAKALGPHAWWLAFCTVFWPFCAAMHAEQNPRATTQFFWLRFLYMLSHRKLFITVAEKEVLLSSAGTADEAVDAIFARVENAAATATGTGRRLAVVSYVLALFTFTGVQIQPVMAQDTAAVVVSKPEAPKPSFSFTGYSVSSLQLTARSQTAKFVFLRVKPVYKNGNLRLTAEIDFNAATKAKVAFIGYDSPKIKTLVEVGRIIGPYAWNFIPPNKDDFNRTPIDPILGVPFFDNGIVITREQILLGCAVNVMLAATNGSGEYEDNNSTMDASGRVTARTPLGTFSFTGQRGQQPSGFRQIYVLGYDLTSGPFTFRFLGVERPDIDGIGFMTSVVTRAGPWRLSAQYDQAKKVKVDPQRFYDLGANLNCSKNTTLKFRTQISNTCRPEYSVRVVQLF